MSVPPLQIFRFPCILTEDILKDLGPFELYCLSTLSARSERVVKAYSSHRQFKARGLVERGYKLSLGEPGSEAPRLKFEFEDSDDSRTVFIPAENTVQVFCENVSEAMSRMLEKLSTIFKISSIVLAFRNKDQEVKDKIAAVVKKQNIKIDRYNDFHNDYSYEEVEDLMGSKYIHLQHPKLTVFQMKRLFKKCIDRPEPINAIFYHESAPGLFTELVSIVEEDKQIIPSLYGGYLRFTQADGRSISMSVGRAPGSYKLSIKVTAEK